MIFETNVNVEKTKEQKILDFMMGEFDASNRFYTRMDEFHKDRWNGFWNHPDFTPQEIVAVVGMEQIQKLFLASKVMQTALKTMNPEYEVMDPPVDPKEFIPQ